jgi:hypothetical protein
MNCTRAREKISAYLDQELDTASVRKLESHLHRCAECREVVRDFQQLNDMVLSLPRIDPGPDFAAETARKVSEPAATTETDHPGRLSLFERISRIAEDFVDLLSAAENPSTGTLDEFSDFPPHSMGHIYFRLMDLPTRG